MPKRTTPNVEPLEPEVHVACYFHRDDLSKFIEDALADKFRPAWVPKGMVPELVDTRDRLGTRTLGTIIYRRKGERDLGTKPEGATTHRRPHRKGASPETQKAVAAAILEDVAKDLFTDESD